MMRVTRRVDHVLRALVRLAQHGGEHPVPAGTIADELGLPRRQVEQEFGRLARAGILRCRRGASGGCVLARPAARISVREVIVALDGGVLEAPESGGSAVGEVWDEIRSLVARNLDAVALADLAVRQDEIDSRATPMYYI